MISALIHKLERRDVLSDEEREALGQVLGPQRRVPAGALIVQPGDRPTHSTFLVDGYCARYALT